MELKYGILLIGFNTRSSINSWIRDNVSDFAQDNVQKAIFVYNEEE